jgi:hypothetical protein
MVLNELLTKQNVITKLILESGDKKLSKELKVKIMRIRMAYSKVKKAFDAEVQEFTDELITDEFKVLSRNVNRTDEEDSRLKEISDKINSEYQEFLIQKGNEEVKNMIDDSLTIDEYSDILDVNSGNDVEINGTKVSAPDFLEVIYDLFVKE